jgi:EAL domain-containing protein (putative c-di-GMP-specific phosphodiesterase class I)
MIGAEALMRWEHPEYGPQYPNDFIPVLEDAGLIVSADLHLFEQVCAFQRSCLDQGLVTAPISVNVSRIDIANGNYIARMEDIRSRYDVPVRLLRVETTETSAVGGLELIASAMSKLHDAGYIVEMDDFGSGYSSLNILKNLPFDIIKLDMRFLDSDPQGRGATIINAMIQMAKWLGTPAIAEGVEQLSQADYLKSVGCSYIQGYLYSRPIPEDQFIDLIQSAGLEPTLPALQLVKTIDAHRFWDPESLETLIFSNYVGAAAVFSYEDGNAEILRVNQKYVQELGMNVTEEDIVHSDPWNTFDDENRAIYVRTVEKAIASGDEQTCETWRTLNSDCCGEELVCMRTTMRVIGHAGKQAIVYAMVQNITAEKRRLDEVTRSERRFRFASEQANMYAWEYVIGTKQMRPCFRCMRDLGLPLVVNNYPEPAIEMGIFPPDYADMYRDWHRKLEEGVEYLEAIIPLTVGRVPFHVRYTTEFDENGRPLKAYGSATMVQE